MSTLVFQGGEEVLYSKQLPATIENMISKIERKSVAKKKIDLVKKTRQNPATVPMGKTEAF